MIEVYNKEFDELNDSYRNCVISAIRFDCDRFDEIAVKLNELNKLVDNICTAVSYVASLTDYDYRKSTIDNEIRDLQHATSTYRKQIEVLIQHIDMVRFNLQVLRKLDAADGYDNLMGLNTLLDNCKDDPASDLQLWMWDGLLDLYNEICGEGAEK